MTIARGARGRASMTPIPGGGFGGDVAAGRYERTSLAVVEAAYRLHQPADAWLRDVAVAAQPALDHGMGVLSVTFRVDASGALRFEDTSTAGAPPSWILTQLRGDSEGLSRRDVHESWGHPAPLETTSSAYKRVYDVPFNEWTLFGPWRERGVQDGLVAKVMDPSGSGFLMFAPLRQVSHPDPLDQARWRRVMTHVVAGLRLRRAALLDDDGDAVLDPAGRVLHAETDARSRTARDALRDAAVTVDRARSRAGRRDPDAALKAWQGLVSGRWSLVDRFDRDGRRFLVARRNDPSVARPAGLSDRERQVVGYAVLGYSNKHIAYALGLAQSTVSNHLRAAMRRMGVRHLSALREIVHADEIREARDEP